MHPLEFLETLFGDAPDELYVLVWTLADKKSHWFRVGELKGKADEIAAATKGMNSYVGVALSPADFGSDRRVVAAQAAGLVGLWADIDIKTAHHSKPNLPKTFEEAESLVNEFPIKPSVLINSGGGLQAWWLFSEPWVFDSPEERTQGAALARRWHHTILGVAQKRGWTLDAVHDLARVMRLPGTFNQRTTPPAEVQVIGDGPRVEPSDFEKFLVDDPSIHSSLATVDVSAVKVDADVKLKSEDLEDLLSIDVKVRQTWENQRRDLADGSPSGYCMALANYAVLAGWDDQAVADLMLTWRRKHGAKLDLDRPDKYRNTIAKARAWIKTQELSEGMTDLLEDIKFEKEVLHEISEEKREKALESLSAAIGFRFEKIIRYYSGDGSDPEYQIQTSRGPVQISGTPILTAQTKFRDRLAGSLQFYLSPMPKDKWDKVAALIIESAETDSTGSDSTTASQTVDWIVDYAQKHIFQEDEEEWWLALDAKRGQRGVYRRYGGLWLEGKDLRAWIGRTSGIQLTPKEFGVRLKRAGFEESGTQTARLGDAKKARSWYVWRIPDEVAEEIEAARDDV